MKGVKLRWFPTAMQPCGIATGNNNSLWVVLQGGGSLNAVAQYSKKGHVIATYKCNGRFRIYDIAVDRISDKIVLTITRRSGKTSQAEAVWFRPAYTNGKPICNLSRFGTIEGSYARSVTVDRKGNIFIADRYNHRVLKYDKNGVYVSSFGSQGLGSGSLHRPRGVSVDGWGRVIVADTVNHRVEMFTAEGDHVCTVAYIKTPLHVAVGGDGHLVVYKNALVTILPQN
uniref:SMP-30/Gluconolactonase/LRE-like region domain-containing protein n=1 Tax=Branchiostoma floridae TaxID=7739 RepID=C3YF13_BRAFL|eukprot:XP_002605247.1 hypothetical protein BRAFLDRAFT_92279 [Branchiostoma floridae]